VLRQRLISGITFAVAVIGLMAVDAWLSTHPFHWYIGSVDVGAWISHGGPSTVLLFAFTLAATHELIHFAHQRGYRPLRVVTYIFAAGLAVGPWVSFNLQRTSVGYDEAWGMLWLALALAVGFFDQAARRGTENVIVNLAVTILFIFYAGGLMGYMTKLRMEIGGSDGTTLLLFSMFVVKITDTGAYFTGRLIGRHPFVPKLSPKKTWEGVVGGVVIATMLAVVVGGWLHNAGHVSVYANFFDSRWGLVVFGLTMACFSVAGDLCESLLKRDAAIKDSGSIIPGMGGILDVLDSPLLSAPAAWFFWTRLVPAIW
jgi:phosphatidate cytidylyltransferase